MFDFDNFREIWSTIKKNKLRTFLTGFAVSWGIFMLITLLGAGNGLRNGIIFNFRRFSANTVEVWGRYTTMPYKGNPTNRRIRVQGSGSQRHQDGIPGNRILLGYHFANRYHLVWGRIHRGRPAGRIRGLQFHYIY